MWAWPWRPYSSGYDLIPKRGPNVKTGTKRTEKQQEHRKLCWPLQVGSGDSSLLSSFPVTMVKTEWSSPIAVLSRGVFTHWWHRARSFMADGYFSHIVQSVNMLLYRHSFCNVEWLPVGDRIKLHVSSPATSSGSHRMIFCASMSNLCPNDLAGQKSCLSRYLAVTSSWAQLRQSGFLFFL